VPPAAEAAAEPEEGEHCMIAFGEDRAPVVSQRSTQANKACSSHHH
jgi:hypothetical protein